MAAAAYAQANSIASVPLAIYDLDDISADGIRNAFPLNYNGVSVANSIPSPWNLTVSINGLLQPAFNYKYDTTWNSGVWGAQTKGYTIDISGNPTTNSYIKFAKSVPINAQVLIRTQEGNINPVPKVYPFLPTDILMGY